MKRTKIPLIPKLDYPEIKRISKIIYVPKHWTDEQIKEYLKERNN